MKYLADTNIVLRIADTGSAQHLIAAQAVARLLANNDEICLAPQVISEFWVVASRPTSVNGLGWSVNAVEQTVVKLLKEFLVLTETPAPLSGVAPAGRAVSRHRKAGRMMRGLLR